MSKKKKKAKQPAAKAKRSDSSVGIITGEKLFGSLLTNGYTSLDQNPEVLTCCRKIADLISSMTIHLMANTQNGDQRIVNELSKHVDIYPNRYMTRKVWMNAIVMDLLLYGKGNAVVIPQTEGGRLGDLVIQPPSTVSFIDDGYGYKVNVSGEIFEPDELLHFVLNPDRYRPWKGTGINVGVMDVVNNLKQARSTEKGFLESNWKPAVIIKVDGLTDEFSTKEGRKTLIEEYVQTDPGEPWIVPSEFMDVQSVKPLSLSDLAIKDTVELNKKTIAAIIGVPGFLLGIGTYNETEWNSFINTTVKTIAEIITQEMTKKLLISEKMYFKFNAASLYSYDIQKLADVYSNLRAIGVVTGNEVRDKLGLSPREEDHMNQLVMLENYIPADKAGDQKKLKEDEKDDE